MTLRPVRLGLHVGAATLLALGGVLLTGSPGHAAAPVLPDSYGGDSTATAMHFSADRNPQPTPVTDLFHAELSWATTSLDSSGNASGRAASIFPGDGLLGVPSLFCQVRKEICLPVPQFPVLAQASYPVTPDDAAATSKGTQSQGPLTVQPNVITAHADPTRVEATSEAAGAGVSTVVSADSVHTHSKQSFEGSTLVVTAESAVKNLEIGGRLHIDSVRSLATARVDGGKVSAATVDTTVSGATLAGQPVTIDSTGIHAGGSGDGGALNGAANTALKALDASGFTVRTLVPTKTVKPGAASANTGGLLVTFAQTVAAPAPPQPPAPIPGPPPASGDYRGSVTIAGAGVAAFATPADLFGSPAVDVGSVGGPATLPTSPLQPAGTAPQTGAAPAPAVGAAPPAAAPVAAAAPPTREAAVLGVDLSSKRLRVLALVLLGYPLLVLLSAPLRAPARLPRVL
jgi:hypothetical protein